MSDVMKQSFYLLNKNRNLYLKISSDNVCMNKMCQACQGTYGSLRTNSNKRTIYARRKFSNSWNNVRLRQTISFKNRIEIIQSACSDCSAIAQLGPRDPQNELRYSSPDELW